MQESFDKETDRQLIERYLNDLGDEGAQA